MSIHKTYGIITKIYALSLVVIAATLYATGIYPSLYFTQSEPVTINGKVYIYQCANVTMAGMPFASQCDTLRIERPDTLGMKRLYR
jgi:hypothetical protein